MSDELKPDDTDLIRCGGIINIPKDGITKVFIQNIIERMTSNDAAIVIEQLIRLRYEQEAR